MRPTAIERHRAYQRKYERKWRKTAKGMLREVRANAKRRAK